MKPFDLQKALAGEPVKLRDGTKAYVKYVMPDDYEGNYPLRGFYKYQDEYVQCSWMRNGNFRSYRSGESEDIIGMWEEPRPRATLTLPCPLIAPQEGMWYIAIVSKEVQRSNYYKSNNNSFDEDKLDNGFYFATREDAQEWLDAMRNARR